MPRGPNRPSPCRFRIASIDTNNAKRDDHLRRRLFQCQAVSKLDVSQHQGQSGQGGFEVTGDLELHGVTKAVTFTLKGGGKVVEFPKGTKRIGLVSSLAIRRSDFGVGAASPALGDDVNILIGVEGTR